MHFRLILILLLISGSLITSESKAQEACGTVVDEEQIKQFLAQEQDRQQYYKQEKSGAITIVPVQHTIVRTSSGTGGASPIVLPYIMASLNDMFAPANIEFVECEEVRFIDSDTYYNFSSSQESGFGNRYDIDNVINIYYFNNVTSGNTPVCGYTRLPPSPDRIMIAKDCANPSTVNHEMGHFLSLYHTHGTTNFGTTDELVDGSNCSSAGDFLCDTPADPNLQQSVDLDCTYVGTDTDANGDPYEPMVNNIMSYARSACRDTFTNDQLNLMEWSANNPRNYLVCPPSCRMSVDSLKAVSCFDGDDGYVELSSEDANTYNWSDGYSGAVRSNVKPGNYIIVSNGNGCQDSLYLEVENPSGLDFNKTIDIATCNGTNDGGVEVSVQGGTSFMSPNHSVLNSRLQMWLRSDRGVSKDAFGNLSQWVDYSGKSHHMSQNDYKLRPSIDSLDHDTLRFQGIRFRNSELSDIVNAERLLSNGTFDLQTVLLVLKVDSPNNGSGPFGEDQGDKGFRIDGTGYSVSNQLIDIPFVQNRTPLRVNSQKTLTRPGSGVEELHVVIMEAQSPMRFKPSKQLSLGGFGIDTAAQFEGRILEFAVFSQLLDLREKEGLERYVAQRYALPGPPDVGPNTYSWNTNLPGDTGLILEDRPSGDYVLTVTDGYGCEYTDTTVIPFKKNLIITAEADSSKIDISVYNGKEPLIYQWSNGAATEDLNSVDPGQYTVTVVDADSCWQERTIDLWATGIGSTNEQMMIYPQPAKNQLNIRLRDSNIESVGIYNTEGSLVKEIYLKSNSNTYQLDLTGMNTGLYIIRLSDIDGHTMSSKITVLK